MILPTRVPAPRRPPSPPIAHGGADDAELARLGINPATILDFSVNSHPAGTSPRAREALAAIDPSRYPDRHAGRIRAALARLHDVGPDEVVVGNGSVELIWLLAQVYLGPGDHALTVGPTFGEYGAAVRTQGAEEVQFVAEEEEGFQLRLDDLAARVRAARPRMVFLCNPNNPTGQLLAVREISQLLKAGDELLLVIDEAYIDFAEDAETALALRHDPRVVVLRSLTKNFGLAGLRLGYAVANRSVVQMLERARPPWTVNAAAQAAGLAALGDTDHLDAGRQLDRRARAWLIPALERLGWPCLPTRANYWLVRVGDGAVVRERLLRRGILVRDCASFGLPDYIRIASRPIPDCERLLGAATRPVSSSWLEGRCPEYWS